MSINETETGSMKTRRDIAHEESTRDPVFVFQTRRYMAPEQSCEALAGYAEEHGWNWCDDTGWRWNDDEPVPCEHLVELGYVVETWETSGVFETREEATAWAEARAYRWPDGWRVYCVCAEGSLAQTLDGNHSC